MDDDVCGVCLEPFTLNNTGDELEHAGVAITKCGHFTHLDCFIKAIQTSDLCIYCRKELKLKSLTQPEYVVNNVLLTTLTNTDQANYYIDRFSAWNTANNRPTFLRKLAEIINCFIIIFISILLINRMMS